MKKSLDNMKSQGIYLAKDLTNFALQKANELRNG